MDRRQQRGVVDDHVRCERQRERTVAFRVAANTGAERTGTLTIAGQTFTVTQAAAPTAACAYTIAPPSQSIGASGGPGTTVTVTTTAGCAWTAVSNAGVVDDHVRCERQRERIGRVQRRGEHRRRADRHAHDCRARRSR